MFGRLFALWLLGSALVITLAKRLLIRKNALRRFFQLYESDGLRPTDSATQTLLLKPGQCVSCGQCDRVAPDTSKEGITASSSPALPLSVLLTAGSRSLLDRDASRASALAYSSQALDAAEGLCEFRVPIRAQVESLQRDADESP